MTIKGIKTAVGKLRQINSGGAYSPKYGVIMLDRENGTIWVDEFNDINHNTRNMYTKGSVIDLLKWSKTNRMITESDKLCMSTIKRLADAAIKEYKNINLS